MTAPNAELAYRVLDHIDAHPEQWFQNDWAHKNECGTSYCFAGWAVLLAGRELIWDGLSETYDEAAWVVDQRKDDGKQWIGDAAREVLGIDDSYDLFRGLNSRKDLGRLVEEFFGPRPAATS